MGWLARVGPGLALCAGIAAAALAIGWVEEVVLGRALIEPLVVALLVGAVMTALGPLPRIRPEGVRFAAREILEVAVASLGLSIDLGQVVAAGPALLVIIVAGMAVSFGVAFGVSIALGLSPRLASLIAIGNAVCGNSAIAALAPIVRATAGEIASAVGVTAVLGLALVLALPAVAAAVALSQFQYGVMAGMTVYAVPQVLAAAAFGGAVATDVALLVKLTRVILLAPIILVASIVAGSPDAARQGSAQASSRRPRRRILGYIPWFVWVFAIFAIARTIGLVPIPAAQLVRSVGGVLTVVAMAGLGLGVNVWSLRQSAPRVGLAVGSSLVALCAVALVLVLLLERR